MKQYKIILIIITSCFLVCCGKLQTQALEDNKRYVISKYHNGILIDHYVANTEVYLKFNDEYIMATGSYTIKQETEITTY